MEIRNHRHHPESTLTYLESTRLRESLSESAAPVIADRLEYIISQNYRPFNQLYLEETHEYGKKEL